MMLTRILKYPLIAYICSQRKTISTLTEILEEQQDTINYQIGIIAEHQQKEREWYQKLFGEEKKG